VKGDWNPQDHPEFEKLSQLEKEEQQRRVSQDHRQHGNLEQVALDDHIDNTL
jgi:hypothetical protein